jgi:hypothetical protein
MVMNSKVKMIWNVAQMGDARKAYGVLVGNLLKTGHLED